MDMAMPDSEQYAPEEDDEDQIYMQQAATDTLLALQLLRSQFPAKARVGTFHHKLPWHVLNAAEIIPEQVQRVNCKLPHYMCVFPKVQEQIQIRQSACNLNADTGGHCALHAAQSAVQSGGRSHLGRQRA